MHLPRRKSSNVARRIRISFVAAAALPLLILAAVSYYLVAEQLQQRALREAHALAKDIGMAVYDRLKFVNDELLIFQAQGVVQSGGLPALEGLDLIERTHSLFAVEPGGEISGQLFLSEQHRLTLLDSVARASTEKSLIVSSGTSTRRRLFLLVPGSNTRSAAVWLGAELNTEYLWNTSDAANRPEFVCVLDPNEEPVYCNHAESAGWLAASRELMRSRARPRALEPGTGEPVLTAAWSLYLKPHYQFERWTVLAGIPQSMALAGIRAFDRIFAAIAVLALVLAYVLGSRMIRRNLQPLDALAEAARRLAEGDFAHRVHLHSGDEFEGLSEAFNGMALRIGQQFDELNTLAKLDRALQAALCPAEALGAASTALASLVGPGRCALFCLEDWEAENALWYTTFASATASQVGSDAIQNLGSASCSDSYAALAADHPYLKYVGEPVEERLQLAPVMNGRHVRAEIVLIAPRRVDAPAVTRVRDVLSTTLSKLVLDKRLRYQAEHDWLTGLPNRLNMHELFDQWARQALETRAVIGLLEINLDRFKQVNDSHGHQHGDQLLKEVGRRLAAVLPEDSVISRFGSDEFVVMLRAGDHYQLMPRLTEIGRQIGEELDRPIKLAHREIRLTASMGAAAFPRHGDCFQTMLQNTDAALRAAKTSRRGSLLMFSSGMRDALIGRMDIEQALKGALSNNEILMHYQPVVDAQSGLTVGAEALMRWQRPGIGLVRPDVFIGVAEDSGLIVGFGEYALAEVCRRLAAWRQAGHPIETVSVNVSGVQLADPDFEDSVHKALHDSGLEPCFLTLEVTETALIGRFEESAQRLMRLREIGVKVVIDDFGTGFASFKYLKMLPVDGLKIDRLFVKDLPDSQRDAAIVASLVSLAESSDLKLVAEGIETKAQSEFLLAAGVRNFQGFLFDPGLPVDKFEQRLCREREEPASGLMTA